MHVSYYYSFFLFLLIFPFSWWLSWWLLLLIVIPIGGSGYRYYYIERVDTLEESEKMVETTDFTNLRY